MIICEFCLQFQKEGTCGYGLNIPKRMGCREFDPGIEKFCSNPNDFVSPGQIVQMAGFFGMKGIELKKVKLMAAQAEKNQLMAAQAEKNQLTVAAGQPDSLPIGEQ